MPIYRYKRISIDADILQRRIVDTITINDRGPQVIIDIDVSASSKEDLDEAMLERGYIYDDVDPADTASEAVAHIFMSPNLDGYASKQTVDEHYIQHAGDIQNILDALDGYHSDITGQEHYGQLSNAMQTVLKELDGYASDEGLDDRVTIIQNSLDGYAYDQTVSEHYSQHSDAIQDILTALDGYDGAGDVNNLSQTVDEHYAQHSGSIQSILKDLDGYAPLITENQRWVDSSQQRQDIRVALDGYDGGGFWDRDAGYGYLYPSTISDKVGINTNTPDEFLHIVGNTKNTGAVLTGDGTKSAPGYAFINGTGTGWWLEPNGDMASSVGGQEILEVQIDGRVIISNDTPNYENLVTADNVIPNKKYVDDAIGDASITVEDEGTPLTTAVTKFNFVGAGVTVTEPVADQVLITIPSGSGDVTSSLSLTDNRITRGDGGSKGIQTSLWEIDDNGCLTCVATKTGYVLDCHNQQASGGYGFRIKAGEVLGDIAFHVSDQDDTFQIMELEAGQGFVTFGKTYAQTLSDNSIVYGVDIQHSGNEGDNAISFNTQYGGYHVAGNLIIENDKDIAQVKNVRFASEYDNGNSGAADTINWNNGQKQKSTLTANCTYTFTAPTDGVGNFLIKVVQDGTGGRTVTWPATVKWPGGTAPTLSTGANDIDIVSFYYDGTNYFGVASLDFA